jgi:hypothetical protein
MPRGIFSDGGRPETAATVAAALTHNAALASFYRSLISNIPASIAGLSNFEQQDDRTSRALGRR